MEVVDAAAVDRAAWGGYRRPRIRLSGIYAGPNRSLLFAGRSEGYRSVTRAAGNLRLGQKRYPHSGRARRLRILSRCTASALYHSNQPPAAASTRRYTATSRN